MIQNESKDVDSDNRWHNAAISHNQSDIPIRHYEPAFSDLSELSEVADCSKLCVLTYNILSQMGARRLQRREMGLMDPMMLQIRTRRERLWREIQQYDADIICLQEVDDYNEYWVDCLKRGGYDSVYESHTKMEDDVGLVIAYRKDLFQLFHSECIDLDQIVSNLSDIHLITQSQQHNLALVVHLQPWEQSTLETAFCIVTTQLASSPTLDHIRVLQTEFLCREIARINAPFQLPILLMGTLNALPSSDVYHILRTGRRRPRPQPPREMKRPIMRDTTPSSITIEWSPPVQENGESSVRGYKIAMKNCTSAALGFTTYEIEVGNVLEWKMTMLSAGIPYQFRIAACNEHGYGPYSQPSVPITTPLDRNEREEKEQEIYIVKDIPPVIKPYAVTLESGRTPRYENHCMNLNVSPRKVLQTHLTPNEIKYETIHPRGDRDHEIIHSELYASAYGHYQGGISEPEFTFSSLHTVATLDYIFYSATQFVPYQLLSLPCIEEIETVSVDSRITIQDVEKEWSVHKPSDWKDSVVEEQTYMGEWWCDIPLELPHRIERMVPWLPNSIYPSDHVALACILAIKKDEIGVLWN